MKPYCVYLTIYRGNKLPPFYIGSSSVENLKNGYRGSVSSKMWKETFNSEIKDNPNLFDYKIITYHNNRQEALDREYRFQIQLNVVKNSLYINQAMAAKNGYFGRDVSGKDHHLYGIPLNQEHKQKLSISHIGYTPSEITRYKHSIANKKQKPTDKCIQAVRINNQRKLICPHCGLLGQYNCLLQWHFDNCKLNPNYIEKSKEIIICPYCRIQGTGKSNMTRYHFDNCKRKGVELPIY